MSNRKSTVVVVGAGTWGLPAALQLQDHGYSVILCDRFEPGSPYTSNAGSSRLWRLADTQVWRSRAMLETLKSMQRLSHRLGESVFRHTGMVWRDDASLPDTAEALKSIDQPVEWIPADSVGDYFPGLVPDGRDALFVEQAGVVFPDRLLDGVLGAFVNGGGTYLPNQRVSRIEPQSSCAHVVLPNGDRLTADQVLLAAGPGTPEFLPDLGMSLPLKPYIEQMVFFGTPGVSPPAPDLPGLVDCPIDDQPGMYAMSNGEQGFKAGLDHPLRALRNGALDDDLDRTEDPERTKATRARIEHTLTSIPPHVLDTQVCTWTDSKDGDFIVGRTHPTIVLACGDCGEGFKYAAFMGEYLAALVEGSAGDPEFQTHWDPFRFGSETTPPEEISSIGRH